VVIALLLLVYRASRPQISMLGADPGATGVFADLRRHRGIVPVPGVLIVRPDAPLFYANAELVRDAIEQAAVSPPDRSAPWCWSWTATTRSTSPPPSSSGSWPPA
jgi:MFS superfamily sulfate permease-like transporter